MASAGTAPRGVCRSLQERPWFNAGLEDRWFFIPGIIGTLTLDPGRQPDRLRGGARTGGRHARADHGQPHPAVEFILGKAVPFFLIGLGGGGARSRCFGVLWFHIPFVGNPLVMLLGASLFLLAALGLGLLLSTLARTQQQAFALNFFLVNPFFILSGFAFPIAAMPRVLQWFTLINPLRYFLVVIRAEFLKGVGIEALWPQLLALALLAAAMLTLSVLRFRKSLD